MQQIKPGIFYENAYLGVTLGALVLPHGVIVIDAPLRMEDARSWRSELINQRGGPNRVLVCLDAHPDRTLGARALDSSIIAHYKTAQTFRNRPTIFKGQSLESGSEWETYTDAIGIRWTPPDITFSDQMSLHWGNGEVIIEHHPGPMPGSLWVIVPDAKVAFVGDTILINQPPFLAQADLDAWMESLGILMESYRDYDIVSGRGGLATMEDVRFQRRLIRSIDRALEKLGSKNASPEDTESLVTAQLAKFKPKQALRDKFHQRLQYGMYHYYTRLYRPSNESDKAEDEGEEG